MVYIDWERFKTGEYVDIKPDTTKTLKLDGVTTEDWQITDPETKEVKTVPSLTFHVIEEDGKPVDKVLRIIQKRTIAIIRPYVETGEIFTRKLKISRIGSGFTAVYEVSLI
jgi:hypothetical protein